VRKALEFQLAIWIEPHPGQAASIVMRILSQHRRMGPIWRCSAPRADARRRSKIRARDPMPRGRALAEIMPNRSCAARAARRRRAADFDRGFTRAGCAKAPRICACIQAYERSDSGLAYDGRSSIKPAFAEGFERRPMGRPGRRLQEISHGRSETKKTRRRARGMRASAEPQEARPMSRTRI